MMATSWYLLHEYLDKAIFTDGAQILHYVPVLQPLVQGNLLMKWLRITGGSMEPTNRVRTGRFLFLHYLCTLLFKYICPAMNTTYGPCS